MAPKYQNRKPKTVWKAKSTVSAQDDTEKLPSLRVNETTSEKQDKVQVSDVTTPTVPVDQDEQLSDRLTSLAAQWGDQGDSVVNTQLGKKEGPELGEQNAAVGNAVKPHSGSEKKNKSSGDDKVEQPVEPLLKNKLEPLMELNNSCSQRKIIRDDQCEEKIQRLDQFLFDQLNVDQSGNADYEELELGLLKELLAKKKRRKIEGEVRVKGFETALTELTKDHKGRMAKVMEDFRAAELKVEEEVMTIRGEKQRELIDGFIDGETEIVLKFEAAVVDLVKQYIQAE